ncbi:MAG: D-aminoacyl-tRNA deacylase [Patescibacteria group bacterium]|nr:D-aminoacyl-tRNA deacylase [Patescibacteria group bacterium]MCX7928624.1 D-aminoacyl-tRNA deacylase [Patescibacteria group bacterium]
MRCVLQVVKKAVVIEAKTKQIAGRLSSEGVLVLLGIGKNDTYKDAEILSKKIISLRIFIDEFGKMNKSVLDKQFGVLVVSQFTLYADVKKGNRPSFLQAAKSEMARKLYKYFVSRIKSYGIFVSTGSFGQEMKIQTELAGPVTIILDSKKL